MRPSVVDVQTQLERETGMQHEPIDAEEALATRAPLMTSGIASNIVIRSSRMTSLDSSSHTSVLADQERRTLILALSRGFGTLLCRSSRRGDLRCRETPHSARGEDSNSARRAVGDCLAWVSVGDFAGVARGRMAAASPRRHFEDAGDDQREQADRE